MKSIITILSLILVLTFTLPACSETTIPIKEVFATYSTSAKVVAESDEFIIITMDYDETQNSSLNVETPEDVTVIASPYKVVILLMMQDNAPVMCAYIPVNEDGTLPKGGVIGDPDVPTTILISPAFMFQNMTTTPPTP